MKRFYQADTPEADTGIGIVADNFKEAKIYAWRFFQDYWDAEDYLSLRIKWNKKIKKETLEDFYYGVVEDWEKALRAGLYSLVYAECPECGREEVYIELHENIDKVCCSTCYEEITENE